MEPNEKQQEKAKKAESLAKRREGIGDNVCYERLLRKEKIALKSAEKLGNRLNWFYNIVFLMFPKSSRIIKGGEGLLHACISSYIQ